MLPSNNSKFNKKKGKTKNFPIKQFRFDTTNSPIVKSKDKCSFRVRTILSQQEELMLTALGNTFQLPNSKAFRIALSKVSTIASNELENFIPFSLADSTHKAHVGRSRKYEVRVTKEEKESLKNIARTLRLSEQASVRLVIIYTERSIRAGTLTTFEGCKMWSEGETWEAWSKDKPVSSGKLDALKKARDKAYQEAKERGQEQDELRYKIRGDKIQELTDNGELYRVQNLHGKIDVKAVDVLNSMDAGEAEEFEWNLYINQLQKQQDFNDLERRIEREIFRAQFYGIEITRPEAIEAIAQQDERNRELTDEELQDIEDFLHWDKQNDREYTLESISEELGISAKELPTSEQDKLLAEREEQISQELRTRDAWLADQRAQSVAYRMRIQIKQGQTAREAVNEQHALLMRIAEDGLTDEEKQELFDSYADQDENQSKP